MNNWNPTEDFVMAFSDETGDTRSEEVMKQFITELRLIANKYNFDISRWGNDECHKEYYSSIDKLLKLWSQNKS